MASAAGLFWPGGGHRILFTTIRGQSIEVYGQGLYRYDALQKAAIFRGGDAVTLFLCVPLLVTALLAYRRGSLQGAVLLASMLAYFLYCYASLAFGAAYNQFFLVYIAIFSSSLFALVLAFSSIDRETLQSRIAKRLPDRGISLFLLVAGIVLALVWLSDILIGLASGKVPPSVQSYTTEVTYVIDLGVVSPAALLAAWLVSRRDALGYPIAAIVLTLNAIIGVVVIAQTVAMRWAGLTLTPGQLAAYVGPFALVSAVASWLAVRLFRSIG